MNWSVSAGPTTDLPAVQGARPRICGSRMPRRLSSPLAVALPILARPAINSFDGRWMSGVSIIKMPPSVLFFARINLLLALQDRLRHPHIRRVDHLAIHANRAAALRHGLLVGRRNLARPR